MIIIGAGPAGLMAGAHIENKKVLILEKGNYPAKKLMISGSGRCNFSHDGNIKDFILHYGTHGKFLKPALYQFNNNDTTRFFEDHGVESIIDSNGKIFPASNQAKDVLSVLMSACRANEISIKYDQSVQTVEKINDEFVVKTETETYFTHAVLVSTGGRSYPKTGSTGDGYKIAKAFGHSIIPPKPALTSILFSQFEFVDLAGVAIYHRQVSIFRNNKKVVDHFGDIGFTHKGLSGPGILDISRYLEMGDEIRINLCNISSDELQISMIDAWNNHGKTLLKSFLKEFEIPESLILRIFDKIDIPERTTMSTITKEQRKRIIKCFSEMTFVIEKVAGFNQAMATAGGVNIDEINPKSMESKLVKNLYFAGEVLDIDGDTGGYNIQAAFSTGVLVAKNNSNPLL